MAQQTRPNDSADDRPPDLIELPPGSENLTFPGRDSSSITPFLPDPGEIHLSGNPPTGSSVPGTSFCFDSEGRVRPCAEGEAGGSGAPSFLTPSIMDFLNRVGGGGGGGGSGGGGGGGATGGTGAEGQASGSGQPQNVQALRDLLTSLVSNQAEDGPPQFQLDPRFAELFASLQQEAAASAGQLAELDPAARADFDRQEAARLAELQDQAQQGRDELLTRLFSSGAQQSSIAASQAGDFAADVARAQQGVRGDIAGQRLQTRQFLTQQNLANLQLRFDALATEQQGALQELGINAEAVNAERNRNSRLLSDILGFETQERTAIQTARIGASAQVRAAQISAGASRFAARLGAATDLAGLGLQRELGLLNRDIALRELDLARRGQDVDERIARIGGAAADRASRRASRASTIGTLGSVAISLAGMFSDERLKQDIQEIGYFGPIRIVTFKYLGKQLKQVGFIAQEVQKYFPNSVHISTGGFLIIKNYNEILGV